MIIVSIHNISLDIVWIQKKNIAEGWLSLLFNRKKVSQEVFVGGFFLWECFWEGLVEVVVFRSASDSSA